MSIVNKISNFLIHSNSKNITENEILHRNLLLKYTLIIIASFSIIFSTIHFFYFEKSVSYFLFINFITFSILFFIFRKNENYKICSIISLILITSLYLLIIFAGAGSKTGIIWGLTYPVSASIAFGFKKGNIFSLILLLLTLLVFFIPSNLWASYSIDLKMRYTSAYVGILFIIQYYLRIQQQLRNDNEKKLIEVQRKLYEKDKLLSKLSYQIRTPLNNIVGITNLNHKILEKDTVEEIEISISNLITSVNSISAYSDSKAIKIKGKKSTFKINKTIKKSISLFQSNKYNNLKCLLNLSEDINEYVYGDRLLFIQVILAVIDFFYNNKQSKSLNIDISSLENKQDNSFSLKLTSNESINSLNNYVNEKSIVDLQKVENKEIKIIKDIISSLNSKLSIIHNSKNTSFVFHFYFQEKEDEENALHNNDKINFEKRKATKLAEAVILLVEDDAINSKIMTLNINKYVNNVIIAENGKEALEKFSSTKIDLILMDVRMPLMDGYKTTKKIRAAESITGYKIPIIAVTANVSEETRVKVFEAGMNDYTTKPVNFNLLLKKMEALLS